MGYFLYLMTLGISIAGIATHFYEKKNPYEKINSFEPNKFCQRNLK